jgi:hypothetical protein
MDSDLQLAALRALAVLPALVFLPLIVATLLVPLRVRSRRRH